MTANTPPDNQNHPDATAIAAIQSRISQPLTILSKTTGRSTCSIFKVPKSFKDVNPKLYHPRIISIGPFHHANPELRMMEELKYQYLGQLLSRTSIPLAALLGAMAPLEAAARECYSESIGMEGEEHVEMLVVDGCFLIELFRKVAKMVEFGADDPIASMSWVFPSLLRDLHLLENQMPFFVLQTLFDLTVAEEGFNGGGAKQRPTLAILCLDFFNYTLQRPPQIVWKYQDLKPQHLLDLLRSSFITPKLESNPKSRKRSTSSRLIPPVSKLRQAGIELRRGKSETFLDVKFRAWGVIEMPAVTLDDFMGSLLANCVAYEQCHRGSSAYFTTYATLMDSLVNSGKDVEHLCDKNVVENYFGTEAEIAALINSLGKDVAFDVEQCYLSKLFEDVNVYYQKKWHVEWASFKYTYFNTPWSFISAVAASVLLLLTVLQTLYTLLPYYKSK